MTNLKYLSLSEAQKGLRSKEFTATELVNAHIEQAEATRDLNAFVTETFDLARKQAAISDQRIQAGTARKLEGIPLAIKDLFCTKGIRTTASSHMLENFVPPYESTVTQNLWNAGGVMIGKASLDEFAMGSSNLTSAYGPVKSPWKSQLDSKTYVPGGSSGGSCASVSAYSAMAATATDTGGSIREPASFCGLVGIKPTYGLCSRYGIIAFASSLDQAGPVARTVRDTAIMLETMAGHDPKDATSLNVEIPSYESFLEKGVKGLKIGIPKEYNVEGLLPEISEMWEQGKAWLKEAGAEIHEISLPHTKYALPTYYIIAPAEASSNLARYDGVRYGSRKSNDSLDDLYELTRAAGFGHEVKRRILIGTYVLSAGYYDAFYLKAQRVRRLIANDFIDAFQNVDLILTPSVPNAAFAIGEEPKDPLEMFMYDVLTVTANLAGIPAISIPAALNKQGLPLGLQLLGPSLSESLIFQAAQVIENAAGFKEKTKFMRQ